MGFRTPPPSFVRLQRLLLLKLLLLLLLLALVVVVVSLQSVGGQKALSFSSSSAQAACLRMTGLTYV
jgi:hypothetical protein